MTTEVGDQANATRKSAPELIWRLARKSASSIVLLNEGDAALPLYCLHPISGDVVGLRDLAKLLGKQQFFGIQVPSDRMNGEFGASIEGMARHYVKLLTVHQPSGPVVLAGWSAGAIIALEMAQQLLQLGRDVPVLIALDGAPCNTGGGLSKWHPLYTIKLLYNLPRWIRYDRQQDWSWRGIKRRLESKLAYRFGFGCFQTPSRDTLDAGTMTRILRTGGWTNEQKAFMHAMYKAMIDYRPLSYNGAIIVYETQTQPLYHLRQVGAAWKQVSSRIEIISLKGNHSGLVSQPSIGVIADHLSTRLDALRLQHGARPLEAAASGVESDNDYAAHALSASPAVRSLQCEAVG